jgi:hypothetical protein
MDAAGYGPVITPPVRSNWTCDRLYPCEDESKLSRRPEGDCRGGKDEPYVSLEIEVTRAISGKLWFGGPPIPVCSRDCTNGDCLTSIVALGLPIVMGLGAYVEGDRGVK